MGVGSTSWPCLGEGNWGFVLVPTTGKVSLTKKTHHSGFGRIKSRMKDDEV